MIKVYCKTDVYGTIRWYKENTDILHREDGPAIEYVDGTKHWHQDGKRHRVDGPAVEHANGDKYWCQNGKYHRVDGPAIEYNHGEKQYWLNGIYYENIQTNEEWIIFQIIN